MTSFQPTISRQSAPLAPAGGAVTQLFLGDQWTRLKKGASNLSGAIGVGAGAAGYALASAAAMANPLMWGIGAGLGAAALHSYINGPRPGTINHMTFDSDSDADDPDWTPQGAFLGRRAEIMSGVEPRTDLENEALNFNGDYTRKNIGSGEASWREGRANQLFLQTRKEDYDDEKVGVDYDDIVAVLDDGTEEEIEDRAQAILDQAMGEAVDFSGWPNKLRRAVTHLLGITQIAEEHSSRTQGSALYARGALQAIADGVMTFSQAFNRTDGAYDAAHHDGTSEMRQVAAGTRPVNDHLGGLSEFQ